MDIHLKRIYEAPEPSDGFRILVDRLWPRGVSKNSAHIDLWLKDIAPSTSLRKWFGHEPSRWIGFRDRYIQELNDNPDAIEQLKVRICRGLVTFVYSAKSQQHNHALVLKEFCENTIWRSP